MLTAWTNQEPVLRLSCCRPHPVLVRNLPYTPVPCGKLGLPQPSARLAIFLPSLLSCLLAGPSLRGLPLSAHSHPASQRIVHSDQVLTFLSSPGHCSSS